MARPIVKEERRKQILDAFEICVAKYGVEGATLERTAEQAGLARALIRHNVGNRADLLVALTEQYLKKSRVALDGLASDLPDKDRSVALCNSLFDPAQSDAQLVLVANALIAAAANDPSLGKKMNNWLRNFTGVIHRIISDDFPEAEGDRVSAVALGVVGIYFNAEALYPLGNAKKLASESRQAALLLLSTLKSS